MPKTDKHGHAKYTSKGHMPSSGKTSTLMHPGGDHLTQPVMEKFEYEVKNYEDGELSVLDGDDERIPKMDEEVATVSPQKSEQSEDNTKQQGSQIEGLPEEKHDYEKTPEEFRDIFAKLLDISPEKLVKFKQHPNPVPATPVPVPATPVPVPVPATPVYGYPGHTALGTHQTTHSYPPQQQRQQFYSQQEAHQIQRYRQQQQQYQLPPRPQYQLPPQQYYQRQQQHPQTRPLQIPMTARPADLLTGPVYGSINGRPQLPRRAVSVSPVSSTTSYRPRSSVSSVSDASLSSQNGYRMVPFANKQRPPAYSPPSSRTPSSRPTPSPRDPTYIPSPREPSMYSQPPPRHPDYSAPPPRKPSMYSAPPRKRDYFAPPPREPSMYSPPTHPSPPRMPPPRAEPQRIARALGNSGGRRRASRSDKNGRWEHDKFDELNRSDERRAAREHLERRKEKTPREPGGLPSNPRFRRQGGRSTGRRSGSASAPPVTRPQTRYRSSAHDDRDELSQTVTRDVDIKETRPPPHRVDAFGGFKGIRPINGRQSKPSATRRSVNNAVKPTTTTTTAATVISAAPKGRRNVYKKMIAVESEGDGGWVSGEDDAPPVITESKKEGRSFRDKRNNRTDNARKDGPMKKSPEKKKDMPRYKPPRARGLKGVDDNTDTFEN